MKKFIFAAATALFLTTGQGLSAQEATPHASAPMNPEEMAKRRTEQMAEQLGLSKEQQEKVYQLNLQQMEQMAKMHHERKEREESDKADREKQMSEMRAKQEQHAALMKEILDEKQYAKWEQLQREQRDHHRGGPRGKHPHRPAGAGPR